MRSQACIGLAAGVLCVGLGALGQKATPPKVAEANNVCPELKLSNDAVRMVLYLPDAEKGYYRGQRFDWSGLIARADWGKHTFYGEFRKGGDPAGHDHVAGPAEEFSMEDPPGYDEAKPGQTFMKIGVGLLERPADEKDPNYGFWKAYKIVKAPPWDVTATKDSVTFRQDCRADRGWGYAYTKTIRLTGEPPGFVIEHTLKNTGTKTIDTTQYNHNFTVIDREHVGPDTRIKFGAAAPTIDVTKAGKAEFTDGYLSVPEKLKGSLWVQLGGLKGTVQENDILIENTKAGAGVHIKGDLPILKIVVYGESDSICPEPFVKIKVEPGKEMKWQWNYTFVEREGKK
jgi:hypothetical protein